MAGEAPRRRVIKGLDADQRRELRRQALLDSALDLFARQGYAATTIEQLCQHAYVATKSFYEVFESREACYHQLLIQVTQRSFAAAFASREGAEQTEEAISRALLSSLAGSFGNDIRTARVTFGEGAATSVAVERIRRENRRTIAAYIESIWAEFDVPGVLPGLSTGLVGGLLDIIADWSHSQSIDLDPAESSAQVEALSRRLTVFYGTLRAGMGVDTPVSTRR
ncbi:TetR/AcrR family transcriptional regulator [Nocardioides sp. Bht2]|uniref:TetR/AcrR family transcriptional regulator n=1 Tax=Nocardioides sp. Bht2 TaxID=3392297 RepID=UPI0039B62E51